MTAKAPNVFDKYRIIAKLGRGGMADVYLTAASGPGGFSKLLVVKVLQDALARDSHFLRMFSDEARLAARLNHPNIVQTYEVGAADGRHYIAMEYLEGQPLHRVAQVFQRRNELSVALSLRVAIDALSGLHYAHELADLDGRPLGVVHRDITPQNVFVTYEGQVKLVDFGIAKVFDSTIETQVGTIKGKVSYMAPEQARGEAVDRRADIFSMGIVVWELLAQKRLWQGLTDIAVIGRLVQGDIPHLAEIGSPIPHGVAEAVMRALHPDPTRRPQTAREMQEALELEFERLEQRLTTRALGEQMRGAFGDERARARGVIKKQLERMVRDTPTGVTPPGGWKLGPPNGGEMPVLGEGSYVHDAVTTIHTGMTGSEASSTSGSGPRPVTSVTDAQLIRQNRSAMWIAVAAVGIAGLAVGVTRPWERLPTQGADEATGHDISGERRASLVPAARANADAAPVALDCGGPTKPLVELTGEISDDAELTCTKNYLLRFTTYVTPGTTLKIQPGTSILGDLETKGTLVVQPGARIEAVGTKKQPIVFTSSAKPGQKKAGDWGGLILLGRAPTNLKDATGAPMMGRIEGITNGGEYGGDNENDSSGVLSHVRIEFSGTEIAPNNEINGLTLGAVGRGTVLDHVQVRHTADDCFEFFGGTADAKYLVCQSPGDDAFDWDYGYTGRLQFLVAQMAPRVSGGSNGFEGDNDPNGTKNTPVSSPLIYNFTLCGKNRAMESDEHYGVLLRRGSEVRIRNGLFVGFGAGVDVRDAGTRLNIAASTFFRNLVHNLAYPESKHADRSEKLLYDDDQGFDEIVHLTNKGLRISEEDPKIGNCFDQRAPKFKPQISLIASAAIPPADGFFDPDARYVGAFRDEADDWDAGEWLAWDD